MSHTIFRKIIYTAAIMLLSLWLSLPTLQAFAQVRPQVFTAPGGVTFPQYTITDLGMPDAYAINNKGQVIGGKYVSDPYGSGSYPTVVLWNNENSQQDLNIFNAIARCINDNGVIAGSKFVNGLGQAFLYRCGKNQYVPIGVLSGKNASEAFGIDAADRVVGASGSSDTGKQRAFLYQNASLQDLGAFSMAGDSNASAVNNGYIVGYAALNGIPRAFRHQGSGTLNTSTDDLGTLGGMLSWATGVNASGQAVGWSDIGSKNTNNTEVYHAFLYANGKMNDLGTLPELENSTATAINSSGQVVGFVSGHAGFTVGPFCWTPTVPNGAVGTMQNLNALIPDQSNARVPWDLQIAKGINNYGQIVGVGMHSGIPRAFLLTPVSSGVSKDKLLLVAGYDGKPVDGIVCDNLRSTPEDQKDYIKITLPDYPNADFSDSQVVGANAGYVKAYKTGEAGRTSNELDYYPPDEFNENPEPNSVEEVKTKDATRKATLNIRFKSGGKYYIVGPKDIILARPPVVLVHGINNKPDRWNGFRSALHPYGFAFATVNHADNSTMTPYVWNGNGFVEDGALLLSKRIKKTLYQLHNGYPLVDNNGLYSPDGSFDLNSPDTIDQPDTQTYANIHLAARRVDVIGYSYGGVITRWYLNSRGTDISHSWYQRLRPDSLPTTNFDNDVRKVITLGSMWRGVPLINYVNEVVFPSTNDVALGAAPLTGIVADLADLVSDVAYIYGKNIPPPNNVEGIINLLDNFTHVRVPSMEVMAVNSKWMSQLVFRNPALNPANGPLTAKPFEDNVAYGSVAGDNNKYKLYEGDVKGRHVVVRHNPYALTHIAQLPSWFPYLKMEYYLDPDQHTLTGRNYSDGLVPVWSSAIPGSYIHAPIDHSGYPEDDATKNYVIQWFNNATLPIGSTLNTQWNDPIQSLTLDDVGNIKTWQSRPGEMAPHIENDVYKLVGGVGRINPVALMKNAELSTATVPTVTATSAVVSWITATDMDSNVIIRRKDSAFEQSFPDPTLTKVHRVVLPRLNSGTTYYWHVVSKFNNDIDDMFQIQSRDAADTFFQTKNTDDPTLDPKPQLSFSTKSGTTPNTFILIVKNTGGNAYQFTVEDLIFKQSGSTFSYQAPNFIDIPGGSTVQVTIGYEGIPVTSLSCRIKTYSCFNVKGQLITSSTTWLR